MPASPDIHVQRWLAIRPMALLLSLSVTLLGCHDLEGNQALPSGTQDPSYYNNATGALGMRNTAVFAFGTVLPSYIVTTGLLTDELTDLSTITTSAGGTIANGGLVQNPLDERILPELSYGAVGSYASDAVYNQLQFVRTQLLQAMGQLAAYDTSAKDIAILKPSADSVLRGELYALYGYTEMMLTDFFCSGIPLSTLNFQKDFTYRSGSPRDSVYKDAIYKLDTALALSRDSVRIVNFARMGLGRAYLDLGNVAAAADDVSSVPSDYQYQLSENWIGQNLSYHFNLINISGVVSDHEGVNGLPYISSHDPRTTDTTVIGIVGNNSHTAFLGFPRVYVAALTGTGYAPVTVASGIEARLIQAEAALQAHDIPTWLTTLNQLRTSGAATTVVVPDTLIDTLGYTGCTVAGSCDADGYRTSVSYANLVLVTSYTVTVPDPSPETDMCRTVNPNLTFSCTSPQVNVYADPTQTHTVIYIPAGTGGVSGLASLSDPGLSSSNPDSARVALTFYERAFWLYMTGHRQGDLRRQLRQYPQYWHTDPSKVYPAGLYLGLGAGNYGTDVTAPIPQAEFINPLFHGCLNRAP